MAEQIILKCIKCGGDIITASEERLVKCRFCGTTFMMPNFIREKVELRDVEKERDAERAARREAEERLFTTVDTLNDISDSQRETTTRLDAMFLQSEQSRNEELRRLYEQADGLQRDREFDKAADVYRKLLVKGCTDTEIYWRLVLCHYCVDYQLDNNRLIPMILNLDLTDPEALSVRRDLMAHVKPDQSFYLDGLREIDSFLDRYRKVRYDMDFDVFISVKQTIDGHQTNDSEVGLKLYDYLTRQGLRVFNSKRRDLLPDEENYEPYIVAALMSARALIVVGTCAEHMNAQWVRNEWSRFQWLQKNEKGGSKRKLFCYLAGGMQPCDIPRALSPDRQAIVDGIGAEELLLKALDYLMPKVPAMQAQGEAPLAGTTFEAEEQKFRSWLSMGRFDLVSKRYEEMVEQGLFLDQPRLYLYALCAERHVREMDRLANTEDDLAEMRLFKLAQNLCADEDEELEAMLKQNAKYRLVTRAEKGDPQAQYEMAQCFFHGTDGMPKDTAAAINWYRKAAEQGHVAAQCMLGRMYENAMGVPMRIEEARKWYLAAAEQGNVEAQIRTAHWYDWTDKNRKEAANWYLKAAQQGDMNAQFNLATLYEMGSDPRPNTTDEDMYISGVWENVVTALNKDYKRAADWYRKSAFQGYAEAQRRLGMLYEEGTGVAKDPFEAVKWYRMAAEQGDAKAQNCLGMMYDSGTGVEQNYEEAFKWFLAAAEKSDVEAQINLGLCYANGDGVQRDYKEAEKWFYIAAMRGDALGQYYLGLMYLNARGVKRDYSVAAEWFQKSAEQEYDRAQYKLGLLYEKGHGVKRDREEAAKWYLLAAEQGNADALKKCARLGIQVMPKEK